MRRRFAAVFVMLHLQYRRGAASLRQGSGAKITVLMCEQKSYQYDFHAGAKAI